MDLAAGSEFVARQTLMAATPLLLAGYGELIAQRAGVINVGIEGTMLMGTIAAYGAAVTLGSAAPAIPAAIGAGLAFGAIFALLAVWCRADQIVSGTAMNILAVGASTLAWRAVQLHAHAAPPLFEPLPLPGLAAIPWLGPALFQQYALFYVVALLGAAIFILLRSTRLGLVITALGDAPDACAAAGIRVRAWRTACLLLAGASAGAAGAYLSTMRNHSFQVNMTNGRGFLVLAMVIFGRWNILGLVAGTLCFGALDALQTYLAANAGATGRVPHQLFDMLPYLATLAALAALTRGRGGPLHLGRPWPPDR